MYFLCLNDSLGPEKNFIIENCFFLAKCQPKNVEVRFRDNQEKEFA